MDSVALRKFRISFSDNGYPIVCRLGVNSDDIIVEICPFLRKFAGQELNKLETWLNKNFDEVELEIL